MNNTNQMFYPYQAGGKTKQQLWDTLLASELGDKYGPKDITDRDIQHFLNREYIILDEFLARSDDAAEENFIKARKILVKTVASWIRDRA